LIFVASWDLRSDRNLHKRLDCLNSHSEYSSLQSYSPVSREYEEVIIPLKRAKHGPSSPLGTEENGFSQFAILPPEIQVEVLHQEAVLDPITLGALCISNTEILDLCRNNFLRWEDPESLEPLVYFGDTKYSKERFTRQIEPPLSGKPISLLQYGLTALRKCLLYKWMYFDIFLRVCAMNRTEKRVSHD
jgi:hypothetical protein